MHKTRACDENHLALTTFVVETPHGPARVHLHAAETPRGAIVLGHGAGGGVAAPDLVAAKDVALEEGFAVALVEQPYRVAGRRSPAPAHQLDAAWIAVLERLRGDELVGPAARDRRAVVGRARRMPHRKGDGRRRRALPRLSGPPARAARSRPASRSSTPSRCRCSSSRARAIRSGCPRGAAGAGSSRSAATTA